MVNIDVIMLSYAKTPDLKRITQESIDSLLKSENQAHVHFDILIIESNRSLSPFQFTGSKTIYPTEKFGYHRYLNIGIRNTYNPYLALCNNDLFFHPNWVSEMVKIFNSNPNLQSLSPFCPIWHPSVGFQPKSGLYHGYEVRKEVAGWCLFIRRELISKIGFLDENLEFWFCDNDYAMTLKKENLNHALVSTSFVSHLEGKTYQLTSSIEKLLLTKKQEHYFNYKWGHKNKLKFSMQELIIWAKIKIKKFIQFF